MKVKKTNGTQGCSWRSAESKLRTFLTLTLILTSLPASAASNQVGDSKLYSFQAKIKVAADCAVSNDRVIEIPFGNVNITKIDSGSFVKNINYDINCTNFLSGNTVALQFIGTSSNFDSSLLGSDVPELGVRILKDGSPMALNANFTIPDPSNPPKLQVQLVKNPAAALPNSAFSATGTLMAIYY